MKNPTARDVRNALWAKHTEDRIASEIESRIHQLWIDATPRDLWPIYPDGFINKNRLTATCRPSDAMLLAWAKEAEEAATKTASVHGSGLRYLARELRNLTTQS